MMNSAIKTNRFTTGGSLLMAAVLLVNSGCEQPFIGTLVNGANLKPKVKYKPSTTASAAAEVTSAEATEVASAGGVGTLRGKFEFVGDFKPLPLLHAKGSDVKDAAVCAAV